MHPRKKAFLRPHELLNIDQLGDLWLEVAAKGYELQKKEMEETIQSLDNISVGESDDERIKVIDNSIDFFSDVPEEIFPLDSEESERE